MANIATDRGISLPAAPGTNKLRHFSQQLTSRAEYIFDSGMPQWLAKLDHVLSPLRLEKLFLGRHKIDHFRIWYRNELADYIKEILLDPRTLARPYLERRQLQQMTLSHVNGTGNYTEEMLRAWAELISKWMFRLRAIDVYFNNDQGGHAVRNALTLQSWFSGSDQKKCA